ncbi:hypothetical protein K2P97_06815 [bacterium]|nr:hypothetical protein [bacterium]
MKKIEGSGRQKGTPNKKTLILTEILDSLDCDVTQKLTELLPQLQPEKQADVLLELMSYIFPKRKALELTGADGGAIQINALTQLTPEERNKRINQLLEKQNADN